MKRKRVLIFTVLILLCASLFLSACQPAANNTEANSSSEEDTAEGTKNTSSDTEEESTTEDSESEETSTEEQSTEETMTETEGPTQGGTLHLSISTDPETFDIHKRHGTGTMMPMLGATLLARDPETNEYVGYLAESWNVSEDGLIYEFKLKENVFFHNGDPLTAHDFVYTIGRAIDPEIASPMSGTIWSSLSEYEALDDYTLRLTLPQPYYPWLLGLSQTASQPVSQRAIEELGDSYEWNPVGVGPFMFKEYVTGEKVVLERNPDFAWAPDFLESTAPYIETVEFRIIAEYSTRVAGLEAGELDLSDINYQDHSRFSTDDQYDIAYYYQPGMWPFVAMNNNAAPFDNVLVRQAFNYAVNREALITILLQGNGIPLYGPITHSTIGYDAFVDDYGYHFDLDEAKAKMVEAGYTYDEEGMLLTPEGEPFTLEIVARSGDPVVDRTKIAEVLLEQFKALGVNMNILIEESALVWERLIGGDYTIAISGLGWSDAEMMYIALHSSYLGAVNQSQVNDPVLDELLSATNTTVDPEARQEAVNEAVKYIIDQAIIIPIYSQKEYYAINSRLENYILSPVTGDLWIMNAYIAE